MKMSPELKKLLEEKGIDYAMPPEELIGALADFVVENPEAFNSNFAVDQLLKTLALAERAQRE